MWSVKKQGQKAAYILLFIPHCSLVCAVALATDRATLGRASSVRAFVKRGENSGHARLSLHSNAPGHDIRITRKIDTNNKSEWLLDGSTLSKKEIIDVTKKFNSQFLPQDRVCEFICMFIMASSEKGAKSSGFSRSDCKAKGSDLEQSKGSQP